MLSPTVTFKLNNTGVLVPVAWELGPAYCAYCENYVSISFPSLYRHMLKCHKEDMKNHKDQQLLQSASPVISNDVGTVVVMSVSGHVVEPVGVVSSLAVEGYQTESERRDDVVRRVVSSPTVTFKLRNNVLTPVVWELGPELSLV